MIAKIKKSLRNTIFFKYKQVVLSRSKAGTFAIAVFLTLMSAFMFLPVFYSLVQAFKPIEELFVYPPRFFVINPTLENFKSIFQLAETLDVPFGRYLFNSLFVAIVGTVTYVFLSSLAAYPLAKGKFSGRILISNLIVWALLFNAEVTAMPRYIVIAKLGLIDTYWALFLPAFAGTMGVFLMKQFISSAIPDSILEAARIDGAGEYKIFFKIVMPSVKAAWLTVIIFSFQSFWGSSGSYIYTENLKQLPAVLSSITAAGIARAGAGAAVGVVMMILPVTVFLISQSSITETMAHSGLK